MKSFGVILSYNLQMKVLHGLFGKKKCLKSVSHVVSPNGGLDIQNIELHLMDYAGKYFEVPKLRKSIPKEWRKANRFREKPQVTQMTMEDLSNIAVNVDAKRNVKLGSLKSKDIYDILMRREGVEIRSFRYSEEKLHVEDYMWTGYFETCVFNELLPRTISDFNWKIFHGVLNTEKWLQKMRLSNGNCVFCGEMESIAHLFMECDGLDNFWIFVESSVKTVMPSISINTTSKILGYMESAKGKQKIFINFLISIGRYSLWKRRNLMKFEQKKESIQCCTKKYESYLKYI